MDELRDREVYLYKEYAPFFINSFTAHHLNLMNQDLRVYYEAKSIPNLRLHLMFVAPPGGMKTYYLNTFGGADTSILTDTGTEIVHRQQLNEASFIGTQPQAGARRIGIAEEHKRSILMVDEFSGITQAMKSTFNNQLESALLAALDHGRIYKDMASTHFDYKTSFTFWTGVQPTKIDISSGLGRRFCYLMYVPTHEDNLNLLDIKEKTRNMKPDIAELDMMHEQLVKFKNEIYEIKHIEFDESVNKIYKECNLFNFETGIFDRLIMGYCVAKYGAKPHTTVGIFDREIEQIVRREKMWRDSIQSGIDVDMIKDLISNRGNSVHIDDLVSDCLLYSWNSQQVGQLVKGMVELNLLRKRGSYLEIV